MHGRDKTIYLRLLIVLLHLSRLEVSVVFGEMEGVVEIEIFTKLHGSEKCVLAFCGRVD